MDAVNETFALTVDACDEVPRRIAAFCSEMKAERRDALRYRLAAEDCLTSWLGTELAGVHR